MSSISSALTNPLAAYVDRKNEKNRNTSFIKKISEYATMLLQQTFRSKSGSTTIIGIIVGVAILVLAKRTRIGSAIGGCAFILWKTHEGLKESRKISSQKERTFFLHHLLLRYLEKRSTRVGKMRVLFYLQNSYLSEQIFFLRSSLAEFLAFKEELSTENTPKVLHQSLTIESKTIRLIDAINTMKREVIALPKEDPAIDFFDDLPEAKNLKTREVQKKGCALASLLQAQVTALLPTEEDLYEFRNLYFPSSKKNS